MNENYEYVIPLLLKNHLMEKLELHSLKYIGYGSTELLQNGLIRTRFNIMVN